MFSSAFCETQTVAPVVPVFEDAIGSVGRGRISSVGCGRICSVGRGRIGSVGCGRIGSVRRGRIGSVGRGRIDYIIIFYAVIAACLKKQHGHRAESWLTKIKQADVLLKLFLAKPNC